MKIEYTPASIIIDKILKLENALIKLKNDFLKEALDNKIPNPTRSQISTEISLLSKVLRIPSKTSFNIKELGSID